jgi:hypothetical protein
VFITLLSLYSFEATADPAGPDEYLIVEINQTGYTDFDDDGLTDDALTVFTASSSESWDGLVQFDCILVLPSGIDYIISFSKYVNGSTLIHIAWINCATETGWYTLEVTADAGEGDVPAGTCTSVIFDPPGGAPGDPTIEVW